MPIGGIVDKYIWAYTNNGSYTIKSGYWFMANYPTVPSPIATPQNERRNNLKHKVWRLKTMPKIKMFIWRVLSGVLALANRLNSRGLSLDATCKLCSSAEETINHVMFQCDAATELWEVARLPSPTSGFRDVIEDNLDFVFQP